MRNMNRIPQSPAQVVPAAMAPKGRKAPRADVDKMRESLAVYSEENTLKKIEERIDSNPEYIPKAIEVVQMLESEPSQSDPDMVSQPPGNTSARPLRNDLETGSFVISCQHRQRRCSIDGFVNAAMWWSGHTLLISPETSCCQDSVDFSGVAVTARICIKCMTMYCTQEAIRHRSVVFLITLVSETKATIIVRSGRATSTGSWTCRTRRSCSRRFTQRGGTG